MPTSRLQLWLELADLSDQRGQGDSRDRFLLLAGREAVRSGALVTAERCRWIVCERQPDHLICECPTFTEALAQPEAAGFWRAIDRFCSVEQAEHLHARNCGAFSDRDDDPDRFTAILDRLTPDE